MSGTHSSRVTIGKKPMSALWAEVFEQERLPSENELRADGWLPLADIADQLGMSKAGTESWCERRKFEKRLGKLKATGQRGAFYRPCKSPSE